MEKKKKTEMVVAQESGLATATPETDVMAFLDQNAMKDKSQGIAVIKAKQLKRKGEDGEEEKYLGIEWSQGDLKKVLDQPFRARIILHSTNYQLSSKVGDDFSIKKSTSESYPGRKDVALFDHELKKRYVIENQKEFRDMFPRADLKKTEDLKNNTIVYLDTEFGICKMYLKPSQYAGAYIEKTGYRYDNPLEGSYRDIERRYPVRRFNYTFEIKPEMYEKNGFEIVYPTFVNVKEDETTNDVMKPLVETIIQTIHSNEKKTIEKDGWDMA